MLRRAPSLLLLALLELGLIGCEPPPRPAEPAPPATFDRMVEARPVDVAARSAARDHDRDGIGDDLDACPDTFGGGNDDPKMHGCPTTTAQDRDGDGTRDNVDECPDEPEDYDGFMDEDGCPDPDNDRDGIVDLQDQCPNEPEDKDGVQDEDGCPESTGGDADLDGIPDVNDKCPSVPEDRDGFEDADGCPETDNDRDGVNDIVDRCPNEAGKGADGCRQETESERRRRIRLGR